MVNSHTVNFGGCVILCDCKMVAGVRTMWLKLDLDGIKLYFKITGYKEFTSTNWYDEWCGVELTVQTERWLNYTQSGDLLLACEVKEILSLFEDLTEDKFKESKKVDFIEPDFKFVLNPKKDLRNDSQYTYVRPGYEIVDINAEFKISFWNGGITENYLSLRMDREDINAFITYLRVITEQISKADASVQSLLNKGILLEY